MARPLRIAHLAYSTLPRAVGGMEVVVDRLIRNQIALGHDVSLVTRWKFWKAFRHAGFAYRAFPLPPRPNFHSDPYRSVGPKWPVAAAVRLLQARHRFDVWHVHSLYPAGWMVHDALTATGVPVVLTPHGSDLNADPKEQYGFRQFEVHDARVTAFVTKAGALTAVSASIEATLLELGADPERIVRIPNGVDAERLSKAGSGRGDWRADLNVGPDTKVVLSVGRNQPNKGLGLVPAALEALLQEGRDICWVIVGQGADELAPDFAAKGILDHTRLLGPVRGEAGVLDFPPDALAELYAAADVLVFPSRKESFGLVALEAMAAGCPVVGNDVEGIRDVVRHEENGLLADAGDPIPLAKAIGRVLDDRALAGRLVAEGRKMAGAHDWATVASRYVDLYRQLETARA